VVTSKMLTWKVLGTIPEASYIGEGSVVLLHHHVNAGVDSNWPQSGAEAYPCNQATSWHDIEDGLRF